MKKLSYYRNMCQEGSFQLGKVIYHDAALFIDCLIKIFGNQEVRNQNEFLFLVKNAVRNYNKKY